MSLDTSGPDWRDGFLFVGDQLAIDFVNTRLLMEGSIELLPDWAAVARWLHAAGLIEDAPARRLAADWSGTAAGRQAVVRLKGFREALRLALARIENGDKPSREFIAVLNRLLGQHPARVELHRAAGGRFERRPLRVIERPEDAIAPLAEAAAALLVDLDPSRIRQCEGCVAHFVDLSRNGLRRWCSMRLCGNRAKVAAYAARHRDAR